MQDPSFAKSKLGEIDAFVQKSRALLKDFPRVDASLLGSERRIYPTAEISNLIALADFTKATSFYSHRRLLGPLVIALKRFAKFIARPFLRIVLGDQIYFNQHMVFLANAMVEIEDRLRKLEAAAETLRGKY